MAPQTTPHSAALAQCDALRQELDRLASLLPTATPAQCDAVTRLLVRCNARMRDGNLALPGELVVAPAVLAVVPTPIASAPSARALSAQADALLATTPKGKGKGKTATAIVPDLADLA